MISSRLLLGYGYHLMRGFQPSILVGLNSLVRLQCMSPSSVLGLFRK